MLQYGTDGVVEFLKGSLDKFSRGLPTLEAMKDFADRFRKVSEVAQALIEPEGVVLASALSRYSKALPAILSFGKEGITTLMDHVGQIARQSASRTQDIDIALQAWTKRLATVSSEEGTAILKDLQEITKIRNRLTISRSSNVGLGDFDITLPNGTAISGKDLIGVSGLFSPRGTLSNPLSRTFQNLSPGREFESEVKILEEIASQIKNSGISPTAVLNGNPVYGNVKGTIKLFSERKPCDSCTDLITKQWRNIFPQVKIVEVNHGPRFLPGDAADFLNEENFTSVLR